MGGAKGRPKVFSSTFQGWRIAVVRGSRIGFGRRDLLENLLRSHSAQVIGRHELAAVIAAECGDNCGSRQVVAVRDGMSEEDAWNILGIRSPHCATCAKQRVLGAVWGDFFPPSIAARVVIVPSAASISSSAADSKEGDGQAAVKKEQRKRSRSLSPSGTEDEYG
jgi:hypothetical protein